MHLSKRDCGVLESGAILILSAVDWMSTDFPGSIEELLERAREPLCKSERIFWTFHKFRLITIALSPSQTSHLGGSIMRIKRFAVFATTLLFVALALSVVARAADQHSGTWKMNPAKSKYSPGPAPTSITENIDSHGENIKLNSAQLDAAGHPTHVEHTATYHGT